MKFVLQISILALISVLLSACCKADNGGNASIVCTVKNSGNYVKGATVYLEYNSSKPPNNGITGFDTHKTADANSSSVTFTGLKCGTYYIYATGYDSAVSLNIQGGTPYSLLYRDRAKTRNIILNITY